MSKNSRNHFRVINNNLFKMIFSILTKMSIKQHQETWHSLIVALKTLMKMMLVDQSLHLKDTEFIIKVFPL
jgi:hypothetical protein